MNKEQIHDEQIYPLMDKIVGICKEHGIAMFASFAIGTDDDPRLECTTHIPDGEGEFDERFSGAYRAVRPWLAPFMITTSCADGSKTMTAIL